MSGTVPLRRFLLLILVALVLAGSFGSGKAYACSCAASGTPSEWAQADLREADVVFTGEAVKVDGSSSPSGYEPFGAASFRVEQLWKGDPSKKIVVHAPGGAAAACGVPFQEGERYLVYAYRSEQGERLETGACDSTQPLRGAMIDLEVLGPPLTGLPETGGVTLPATTWRDGVAILLLASLGIAASCLHSRRSRDTR